MHIYSTVVLLSLRGKRRVEKTCFPGFRRSRGGRSVIREVTSRRDEKEPSFKATQVRCNAVSHTLKELCNYFGALLNNYGGGLSTFLKVKNKKSAFACMS